MSVLIKPIITEKMTADSELYNRYGFVVDPKANKLQIKDAVEAAEAAIIREEFMEKKAEAKDVAKSKQAKKDEWREFEEA